METLDIIAKNILENIDMLLAVLPYSSTIELIRVTKTGQFGYEIPSVEEPFRTEGVILHKTERRFFKKLGIYDEGDLPIIGIFKNQDNFKREDIISEITKDFVNGQEVEYKTQYRITDERTYGDKRTFKRVFFLSPVREEITLKGN
jgi:hypothetical protein